MDQDAVPGLSPGHLGAPAFEPAPAPDDLCTGADPADELPAEPPSKHPDRTGLACGLTLLLLALLAGGTLLGLRAVFVHSGPTRPADYAGGGHGTVIQISVPTGASLTRIGQILQQNQVVASVKAFTSAAANSTARIQPGTYALRRRMSAGAALGVLGNPANANALTIPEGRRASQVYTAIDQRLNLPPGTAQHTAEQHLADLNLPDYAGGNPEGLFYPSTYSVTGDTTALGLLQQMVARAGHEFGADDLDHPEISGLTGYQALVVASLVQGESDNPDDMAKVARVIYNRLARSMPLQLDSTINYALGRTTLHTTVSDTQLDSPFNTYRVPGLPPTPIDNPGHDAIQAALNPAPGDWIYFVTVRPGDTRFTDSEQQQRKNVDEFNAYQARHSASPSPSGAVPPPLSGH
ncbi:endolytic transglycosylase MltG [Kitasatospora sp. NBC_01250]|uniref:endolytic transglycosylase MltG n=1 Tax=unclassified Kitasatospora TaxID=2633591 RepID=UPI002E0EB6E1|nr:MULTISPECIES: endolytic transglycosylase MltG [unclassified Kitasatospora]WSJ66036.1 endolytic transglycosylase MltG [Kitasatospora sp. NBC_01302]